MLQIYRIAEKDRIGRQLFEAHVDSAPFGAGAVSFIGTARWKDGDHPKGSVVHLGGQYCLGASR